MTEDKWLACSKPDAMLDHRQVRGGYRKIHLFDVACCRRVHHLLTPSAHDILTRIEQHADQPMSVEAVKDLMLSAELEAGEHSDGPTARDMAVWEAHEAVYCATAGFLGAAASIAARAAAFEYPSAAGWQPGDGFLDPDPDERAVQCDLLREIFGNPFRPVTLDPNWLTSTVVALAKGIYEERAFDRMPILADALQDAGCENADVLDHCRGLGTHVRGCWVVDLILGKS